MTEFGTNAGQTRFEPVSPFKSKTAESIAVYSVVLTGTAGLEPAARCLEGSYSIQLSYAPNSKIANNIIVSVQCAIEQVNI